MGIMCGCPWKVQRGLINILTCDVSNRKGSKYHSPQAAGPPDHHDTALGLLLLVNVKHSHCCESSQTFTRYLHVWKHSENLLHSLNFIKLLPNVSLLSSTVLSLHAVKVAASFLLSINNLNLPQVLAVPSEDFLENNPPPVLLLFQAAEHRAHRVSSEDRAADGIRRVCQTSESENDVTP